MPILISLKYYIKNKNKMKIIAISMFAIILTLMLTIYFILIKVDVNINELQMPAVYAIGKIMPNVKKIYGMIILISIFTTSISLGMSFLSNTSSDNKSFNTISILMCISGVIFSSFGFSNLINFLYPILGIIGFSQILKIILQKT